MTKVKVDPELTRQLAETPYQGPFEAVFALRETGKDPERLAREAVRRAEEAAGDRVEDLHVFKNLGSFVVRARRGIIDALLEREDAIESAVANRQAESFLIPPVRERPVPLPRTRRPRSPKKGAKRR